MSTIQYLFSALIRLAVALVVVALVWWLVSTLFPMLKARNLLSLGGAKTDQGDWLPAPRNSLFGNVKTPSAEDNVYNPGDAFNGYANAFNNNLGGSDVNFITYDSSGNEKIIHMGSSGASAGNVSQDPNVTYVRNLSIYEGGHIYTGLAFTGDAREIMFKNGKFPILLIDSSNRVINVFYAEATGAPTIPGWIRFQARISAVLPNRIPCAMIFEQATTQYSYLGEAKQNPIRVGVPMSCN